MGGYVLFEVNAAVRKLAELSSSLDLYWAKSQSASVISLSCHVHPRPDILFRHHVVSMIPIPQSVDIIFLVPGSILLFMGDGCGHDSKRTGSLLGVLDERSC